CARLVDRPNHSRGISMRPLVAPSLAALVLTACAVELHPPPAARISCGPESACPSGWFCTPAGRCVPEDRADREAPGLVGEVVVTPAEARAGATVTVRLAVTEPLQEPPELVLATAGAPRAPCVAV